MKILAKFLLSTALLTKAICAQDDLIISMQKLGANGKLHDANKPPEVLQESPYHKDDADTLNQTGLRNVILKLKKDRVQEGDSFKSLMTLEEVEFYYSEQAVSAIKADYGTVPVVGIYFTNEEVMTQDIFINLLSLKPSVIKFFNVSYPSKDLEPTKFDIDRIVVDPNFSTLKELQFFGTWFDFELLVHPEMARLATIFSNFPAFSYGSEAIRPLIGAGQLRELHLPECSPEWMEDGTLVNVLQDKNLEALTLSYFNPYLSNIPAFLTGNNLRRLTLGSLTIREAKKTDVDAFFETLSRHKNLESLDLSLVGWDDNFVDRFAAYLNGGVKLKHLSLTPMRSERDQGKAMPPLFKRIATSLAKMGTLQALAHKSNLADEDVTVLGEVFKGNIGLRKIIIQGQQFSDAGFASLIDAMQGLDLSHLEMSHYAGYKYSPSAPTPLPADPIMQKFYNFLQSQKSLQYFNLKGYYIPGYVMLQLVGNFQTNMFFDKTSKRSSVKIDLSHVNIIDRDLEVWVDGKVQDGNWFKNRTGKIEVRLAESQLSKNVVFNDSYRGDIFELSFYTGKSDETLFKGLPQPKKERAEKTPANSSAGAEVRELQVSQKRGLFGWIFGK